MRKIICLCLIFAFCLPLVGCREEQNAYDILSEFVGDYGGAGVIYSPSVSLVSVAKLCRVLLRFRI